MYVRALSSRKIRNSKVVSDVRASSELRKRSKFKFSDVRASESDTRQAYSVPLETSLTKCASEQTCVLTVQSTQGLDDNTGADSSMVKVLGWTSTLHRSISTT